MLTTVADVDVITAAFNREALEAAEERCEFRAEYVPAKWWQFKPKGVWRFVEHSPLKPLMNIAYSLWQRDATKLAEQLHAERQYDLVHLVTYVGFRFPGKFYRIPVPFIWGPVGGLENTPWRFLPMLGFRGVLHYTGRNVINSLQKRFLPGPKRAFAKAATDGGIIAATDGIRHQIRRWYGHDSTVICEIGPPPIVASEHSLRQPGEPLRMLWSGQHLPGKALPLLLKALAQLPTQLQWELTIFGTGPLTAKWQKLAAKLELAPRCRWMGWIPRDQAVSALHEAHIFIITSLKDLTSTVLLEALSQGLPVICPLWVCERRDC